MSAFGDRVVKPFKLQYRGREFTIWSLGLDPMYEAILYRFCPMCGKRLKVEDE